MCQRTAHMQAQRQLDARRLLPCRCHHARKYRLHRKTAKSETQRFVTVELFKPALCCIEAFPGSADSLEVTGARITRTGKRSLCVHVWTMFCSKSGLFGSPEAFA